MPPVILRSTVDQIVEKLKNREILPQSVTQKTTEQCRILETRCATGSLGKWDRRETRAAVLLEIVMRQETGKRLGWKELAAAVGTKASNLEQLHLVIGNYLQPAARRTTAQKITRSSVAAHQFQRQQEPSAVGTQISSQRHRLRSQEPTTSHIQDLAIRLSAQVADPHGFTKAAVQLLNDLRQHGHTLQAHERRGYFYDLQRYWPAYEAAALYYICTKDKNSQTSRGARQLKDDDEDAVGRPLELEDLVEASSDFTYLELKQVLQHVVQLADKIATKKHLQQKRKSIRHQPQSSQKNLKDPPPSSKIDRDAAQSSSLLVSESLARAEEGDLRVHGDTEHDDEVSFGNWKEQILSQACDVAKEAIREETGTPADEIDDATAMAWAADAVLRKHGLMPPPATT